MTYNINVLAISRGARIGNEDSVKRSCLTDEHTRSWYMAETATEQ